MSCVGPNSTCVRVPCKDLPIEPDCLNLSLVKGTDNELEITITDGDGKAVAITADTITMTVKDEPGGSTVFLKSNGPGAHSAPALGQTIFVIDAADTATASDDATTYWVYEIRRVTGTGDQRVHIQGDFTVRPAI